MCASVHAVYGPERLFVVLIIIYCFIYGHVVHADFFSVNNCLRLFELYFVSNQQRPLYCTNMRAVSRLRWLIFLGTVFLIFAGGSPDCTFSAWFFYTYTVVTNSGPSGTAATGEARRAGCSIKGVN